MLEGMSTAKSILFHQGSTELRRCENCVFFLPVNILTGVARQILGPHDTLPCVLIQLFHIVFDYGLTFTLTYTLTIHEATCTLQPICLLQLLEDLC